MKLTIKGNPSYIQYMYNHLRKEHPSTKKRMIKGGTMKLKRIRQRLDIAPVKAKGNKYLRHSIKYITNNNAR